MHPSISCIGLLCTKKGHPLFAEMREVNKIHRRGRKGKEFTFAPELFALKHYTMQINILAQKSSDAVLRLCLLPKE